MTHDNLWRGLLLGMLTLGVLLTACGGTVPTGEPVTITFACMDHERSQYENLVKDFQKANRDIRVQFVSADEASGMQREGNTVTTSDNEIEGLAAAADTFVWFAKLRPIEWSHLLNLQPFVDDAASFPADDFYPGTLDDFRWQGDLYGLPAEVLPILIFYDKGMFDEAGVAYPETGWTWDDFLNAADRLTEREGDEVIRYGFVDSFHRGTMLAMIYQHGILLWDDSTDPPQPLFDRPEVADVLRRYASLASTYEVMPVPEVNSNAMAFTLINEGKAAMWTAFAFDLDYHSRRIDLGLAAFPEHVAAANPRSMKGFFVSAGTAHPEAAWRWLTYLGEHYQPMLEGNLPGRRSVGERMPWWRRLDKDVRAIIEYTLAHPPPPDSSLNRPLKLAMNAVIEGQTSIEEALATAQSEALALQAELAEAAPSAPQPVPSPQPTPAGEWTPITFTPLFSMDVALYRALAATFNESHPDTQVEVIPPSLDPGKLVPASDCFGSTLPVRYPEVRQLIRNLQPLLEADADLELDDFYPQLLEMLQHNGELWGIPYQADALMVYYNRDRFTETGIPLPGPGWSVDDFLDAAAAMSDGTQYGFTTREGAYGDLIFVLERLGAHLVEDTVKDRLPAPTFDDPATIAALRQYADLSRRHPLSPATPSTQSGWPDATIGGDHPALVRTGRVAMWIDYMGNHAVALSPSFEAGVAPLPTLGGADEPAGTQISTEFNVSAYYISAHTPVPQACWEWLTFLSRQPEVTQLLPTRRSVAASPSWQGQVDETALPAYQATLEYDGVSLFSLRWEIPGLAYTYPWLDEAFQAAVAGDDAGHALAEAQRKAEAYVLCLERKNGFADHETLKTCAREVDPDYPSFGE
ncbi:MAG: extracellular solute-binding protein [Chloroflexota bacterium]|nr:extracellular solute-binding protein [Chloroflexota bacterium]